MEIPVKIVVSDIDSALCSPNCPFLVAGTGDGCTLFNSDLEDTELPEWNDGAPAKDRCWPCYNLDN